MGPKDSVVYSTEKFNDNAWERSQWTLTDEASVCLSFDTKGTMT